MAIPQNTDLSLEPVYTDLDWIANFQQIVAWLTSDADVTFATVTTGGLTVNANALFSGDITAVPPAKFIGDGSGLTNLPFYSKNLAINGGFLIPSLNEPLVNNVFTEPVRRFFGVANGTTVTAGDLIQSTTSTIGITGYSVKFENATITGTGTFSLRHRILSTNAINFKSSALTITFLAEDDISGINYTIFFSSPVNKDDFSTLNAITNSGSIPLGTGNGNRNVNTAFLDSSVVNGLQIEIVFDLNGAITNQNLEIAEFQIEFGQSFAVFDHRNINEDIAMDEYNIEGSEGINLLTITSGDTGENHAFIGSFSGEVAEIHVKGIRGGNSNYEHEIFLIGGDFFAASVDSFAAVSDDMIYSFTFLSTTNGFHSFQIDTDNTYDEIIVNKKRLISF